MTPKPRTVANLHCSLVGIRAAQGRGREEQQRSAHPVHSFAPPASRICVVRRTTQICRAPAGRLPLAPPLFPQGLVAAFVAADSSRTPRPGQLDEGGTVHSRGMRPIFRLPGLRLPSFTGRRPRQSRSARPRGSLRSPCSESANADAAPAGPRAGGGGVWCARRGGGGGGAPPPPPLRGRVSRCRRRRRRLTPLRCCARWGEGEPLATSG